MKIITFNLHQYHELNHVANMYEIAKKIKELDADIICLQEVAEFKYDSSVQKVTNTANLIHRVLTDTFNLDYNIYTNMFKMGFEHTIEGLAIITKFKLTNKQDVLISNTTDFNNYHKRCIQIYDMEYNKEKYTIVNGHYTWDNELESFKEQFERLNIKLKNKKCILAGDFNNDYLSENYNYITKYFKDVSFKENLEEATFNYNGFTSRLDYCFTNCEFILNDHQIIFKEPMYSDHYLVYFDLEIN